MFCYKLYTFSIDIIIDIHLIFIAKT